MKAYLKNYRQAPRKVRLVADAVRGKRVDEALLTLRFLPRKAAAPIAKLIASAFANARERDASLSPQDMVVGRITVDKGVTYFRWRARARGRASRIAKESSHIAVALVPVAAKGNAQKQRAASAPEEKGDAQGTRPHGAQDAAAASATAAAEEKEKRRTTEKKEAATAA